jgi:replicative DNA helicase
MNKLITKSLAELNADFIMQIPLELQTKQEMKWFKWIKDYIATFGQPPTLDRFCIEFSDFVSIETNDPLKDVFFLDVGFRRNSLVREWIIANSESLREGKDPYRELSLFLEKLNVATIESIGAGDVDLSLFTDKVVMFNTGFDSIDSESGGLSKGDLMYIFGRPGSGKCLGLGTKVVMFNGGYKNVEDIVVGDLLMGVDSTPRTVLSTTRGKEMMYWIHQKKGISYRVNKSHILSLKRGKTEKKQKYGDERQFVVGDIANKSKRFFDTWKGWKSGVSFPEREITIDPYFLGLWLGDGSTSNSVVWNEDVEIEEWFNKFAPENSFELSIKKYKDKCKGFNLTGGMQTALRKLGVLGNKHIPDDYMFNTYETRMSLLAGLIDSDGHLSKDDKISYEITLKDKKLLMQVKQLCDSLGFVTAVAEKTGTIKSIDFTDTYYRLRFGGNNLEDIPVKIARKQAIKPKYNSSWRLMPITIVEDKVDDYYGFELSGDGLFLLEDFTVTHNTTLLFSMIVSWVLTGKRVIVISNEIRYEDVLYKLYAQIAGIDQSAKRKGSLTDVDKKKLLAVRHFLAQNNNLHVVKKPIHDVNHITSYIENDTDIVAIDGAYLMAKSPDWKDLTQVSNTLRAISNNTGVAIVGVIQANRSAAEKTSLESVAGSDSFTQDADILLGVNNAGAIVGGRSVNIMSSKNRHGVPIQFTVNFKLPVIYSWEDS